MCLFPLPNLNFKSIQYKKGLHEFDCGACPECLRKRSNVWALRAVYEAKQHAYNCMVTLTYDTFMRDKDGNILKNERGLPIENPVDPDLKVNVRDIQLFKKRLRKWYSSITNEKIKILVGAEYGSRTHRAHYHLILFGVRFPDIVPYKKSKRGNQIYMSKILSDLWKHGICTVDSINIHSAIARYCTKYCAKSRSEETFMLASPKIGFDGLMRDFNGLNYMIDGREYTVPRFVWENYIVSKYQRRYHGLNNVPLLDPRYVNRDKTLSEFEYDYEFERSKLRRAFYRKVRDRDPLYVRYLEYWQNKGQLFDRTRLSARQRILQLDDSKYHFYKVSALEVYDIRKSSGSPVPAPGSGCVSAFYRHCEKYFDPLAVTSRPNTASDTKRSVFIEYGKNRRRGLISIFDTPPIEFSSMYSLIK